MKNSNFDENIASCASCQWMFWNIFGVAESKNEDNKTICCFWRLVFPEHETIIWTGMTCKKIPCYMHNSACRWFIVKNDKIFWSYVIRKLWKFRKSENLESWLVYSNMFFKLPNHVSQLTWNEVSVQLLFTAFKTSN